MNLRREEQSGSEEGSKFNVGDVVRVSLDGGKNSLLGKVLFINTYKNKKLYTVDLGNVFHIGKESNDKDIKLLKPLGLPIRTVNLGEDELSEYSKNYPHIKINVTKTVINPIKGAFSYTPVDNDGDVA